MAAITVKNLGAPIRLTEVGVDGFTLETAREGEPVRLHTFCAITSDQPVFHRLVPNMIEILEARARHAGSPIRVNAVETILAIIKPDRTAELYVDTAAISIYGLVRRDIAAGSAVWESDIADVTAMAFPAVEIGKDDKVVCVFRHGWRFAYCADFNRGNNFDHDRFQKTLGTLYRRLKYAHLYEILGDSTTYKGLINVGWFPFVELIGPAIQRLAEFSRADKLDAGEKEVLKAFTAARLDGMVQRWGSIPFLAPRIRILEEGAAAFKAGNPISSIKVLVTEIEGILQDAYKDANGRAGRLVDLLKFARARGSAKAGADDTLLLAGAFMAYLGDYVFANFNPAVGAPSSGSRHAVGHGAAPQESYTMVRALQAILTVDQIAFFI